MSQGFWSVVLMHKISFAVNFFAIITKTMKHIQLHKSELFKNKGFVVDDKVQFEPTKNCIIT